MSENANPKAAIEPSKEGRYKDGTFAKGFVSNPGGKAEGRASPDTFAPAVRDRVSLLITLAGASGSGKTLSALRIARGLAGGDDAKIAVIDTEAGRAKHYAVAPGEKPGADRFGFAHGDLRPPFLRKPMRRRSRRRTRPVTR